MQSYRTPFAATFRCALGPMWAGGSPPRGRLCRVNSLERRVGARRQCKSRTERRGGGPITADVACRWMVGVRRAAGPALQRVFCRSVSSWGRRSVWGQTLELCRRCGGTMVMMRPPSSRPSGCRDSMGRQPIARGGGAATEGRGRPGRAGRRRSGVVSRKRRKVLAGRVPGLKILGLEEVPIPEV